MYDSSDWRVHFGGVVQKNKLKKRAILRKHSGLPIYLQFSVSCGNTRLPDVAKERSSGGAHLRLPPAHIMTSVLSAVNRAIPILR